MKKLEGFMQNSDAKQCDIIPVDSAVAFVLHGDTSGEIDFVNTASTLIIHDGPHEPVYTATEVRAMVREMVEGVTAGEELTLETIAAKHGVVLDPTDVMGMAVPKSDHAE